MECSFEKEISQDTIEQVYLIAKDYTCDFFTSGYPDDMRIDMQFQRAFLLKNDSEIISCIIFTCLDGSPHITMMATKRNCSHKGYGRLLMQHFTDYVRNLGLNSIELYTFSPISRPEYTATVKFYQDVGFNIEKEHKDLWELGTTTLKMRKSW